MWGTLKVPRAFGYVVPVSATAAIVVGGFPDFTVGSQNFGTWVTRSCEILDVKTGAVRYTDSTSIGHADGCIVRMSNGRVVVLGGVKDGKRGTTKVVEEFDPVTEKWTVKGNLLYSRRQQQAIALDDHRIMIVGGRNADLFGTRDVEIFDLNTGSCVAATPYRHPVTNHRLMMADSNVYVIGGRESGPESDRFADVSYYDEASKSWVAAFNLPAPKPLFEALQVYNGIYTTGGSIDLKDTKFSDVVYFIDKSGATALNGRVQSSVKGHCFTQWVSDSLITFGGESGTKSSIATSWVNTITGTVYPGPDLNIGRRYGNTVFLNGDAETPAAVFAVAGVMSDNKVTPTIEIITSSTCTQSSVSSVLDPTKLKTVGSASFTNAPSVMLTSTSLYSAGAVWLKEKISLRAGISSSFSFRMRSGSDNAQPDGGPAGADGVAFVIQNSSSSPVGAEGQGIGYEDIPNAVAVEFDAYKNAAYSDPSGSHVAIQAQRDKKLKPWHRDGHMIGMTTDVPELKSDGTIYYARIDFRGTGADVYLSTSPNLGPPVLSVPSATITNMIALGLDASAWIGITSATGFSVQEHELLSWSIDGCDLLTLDVHDEKAQETPSLTPIISPAPSADFATMRVTGSTSESVVNIYDVTGRLVWTTTASAEQLSAGLVLPTMEMPTGIYSVQIYTNQSVQSVTWVVQR